MAGASAKKKPTCANCGHRKEQRMKDQWGLKRGKCLAPVKYDELTIAACGCDQWEEEK
jgi:hypothetical protein